MLERGLKPATTLLDPKKPSEVGEKWRLIRMDSCRIDSAATANYKDVCSGRTNHAEVIEVRYDASQTTFGRLLKIHFSVAHDPTQKDRQGNDMGRQYRSAIFYSDEEQKRVA